MSIRRPWILVCVLVMALGLAACGQQSHPTKADANNDGFYVDAGPLFPPGDKYWDWRTGWSPKAEVYARRDLVKP